MQAIVTKYLGPTDHKGARVKARCEAGSLIVSWDDAKDTEANHDHAAHLLADRLGWLDGYHGTMVGGGLPDGKGNCYVFVRSRDMP